MAKKKKRKKEPESNAIAPIEPSEKWVLIGLGAIYLLIIIWGLLSESTWDDDCVGHYFNARRALGDPRQFISLWNRPLFIILFAATAHLGKHIFVFQMGLISVLGCYAIYRACKTLKIPNAYLVIPFTIFQTFFFPISFNALAEPIAATLLAFGFLFLVQKKYLAFAITGAILPLARLELAPLLAIWAVLLIQNKQARLIPLMAIPTILWNFAGMFIEGDPLWLFSKTLGADNASNRYGHTTFGTYFYRYIFVIGPVVYYFLLLELLERLFKRKIDLFVTVQFILGFMIYVIFSWKLNIGQAAGFLRNLIPLSPFAGIIALRGFNLWFSATKTSQEKTRLAIYSVVIILVTFFFHSKKILIHHIVGAEEEYLKVSIIVALSILVVVASYFNEDLLKKKGSRILIVALVFVGILSYTLGTEPPNSNDNPERQTMKGVAQWYLDNNFDTRKTYVNHSWFFYSVDLDPDGEQFAHVTRENLKQAPLSSIVIWESHYSHRLAGDVPFDYMQGLSNFKRLASSATPDKRFVALIYEKVAE